MVCGSATSIPIRRCSSAPSCRPAIAPAAAAKAKSKLSYREEKELTALPGEIEALEREQKALTESLSAPDYPHADAARVSADGARLVALEEMLLAKLERWEHLESEAQRLKGH